jgi:hypothetical protein
MAFFNANPATGDRGARQGSRSRSRKNVAAVHSQLKPICQEPGRADSFGARREAVS